MSIYRLCAIVAALGLLVATAFIARGQMTASASVTSRSPGRENIAERSLVLHDQQAAASAGARGENITERSLAPHDRQAAAGNSAVASPARMRKNIAEGRLKLQDQLAALRAATAQFHRTDAAQAAGYTLVKGLDYCFNNPGVGGMGFHLIKTSSLDLTLNALEPEAMVYAPGPNGQFQLDAVEYIVPADAWRSAGNLQPPSVMGKSLHLNDALGVFILHAWIWRENPAGMFEDWNPKVSCR